MKIFWIPSATLVLETPLITEDEADKLSSYSRSYYLAAKRVERCTSLLVAAARDEGARLLSHESPEEMPLSRVPTDRREPLKNGQEGVVWRTGRVFFPIA